MGAAEVTPKEVDVVKGLRRRLRKLGMDMRRMAMLMRVMRTRGES